MATVGDREFDLLSRLVYGKAGISIRETRKTMLANRLRKRLEHCGLDSYHQYYDFLTRHPAGTEEMPEFIDALTTNETFFHRHPEQIDFLIDRIIPEWEERSPCSGAGPFRIWSAACATGEEPYSIAMEAADRLPMPLAKRLAITGSDINRRVLERARSGCFTTTSVQRMPAAVRGRYLSFDPIRQIYALSPWIRDRVRFLQHNLLDPFPHGRFDAVFCRNVFIYFDRESRDRVLDNLHAALEPGGVLIVGYAESLLTDQDRFEYVQPTVYRKVMD